MHTKFLYHHGILGQRWGKRNGPPYPLGASDHSPSEKKAGWRKSLDSKGRTTYNGSNQSVSERDRFRLTDKQKKAIKIGAVAAGAALVAVGGVYLAKSGKLNALADIGRNRVRHIVGGIDNVIPFDNSFKRLPQNEKIADAIKKANPLRGTDDGSMNCSACCIASFMRTKGYDVVAKSTGGKGRTLPTVLEECFKNAKVLEGSAVKFGKSSDDAAEMIVRRFGDNAAGVCGVQLKGNTNGHVFNWQTTNGIVEFFDGQNGFDDAMIRRSYWKVIDPQGFLQLARLDNAEIIAGAVRKYVK